MTRTQAEFYAFADVGTEMKRTDERVLPATDPVRCAALVAEEAGEVVKAALDLTRQPVIRVHDQDELYKELTHTAAMAIRFMASLKMNEPNGI